MTEGAATGSPFGVNAVKCRKSGKLDLLIHQLPQVG
jgi:hypothetical protein